MDARRALNQALVRATGYELRRPGAVGGRRAARLRDAGDRLVPSPVFILCTLRSGSTLLRVLLNSHSQLHSPHELHFRYVTVGLTKKWSRRSMRELGLGPKKLEYLLWDRILHRILVESGKENIVCKTPNDVFIADRIAECWPDARFLFLIRHPASIVRSRADYRGGQVDEEKNVALIRRYCEALERARRKYPGLTVRYEDLASDPARVTREICEFLGVAWEPEMLDYGRFDHGRFRAGLGDWKSKIRTGEVQPPRPLPSPEEIPAELRAVAEAWGYLGAGVPVETATG